MLTTRRTPDVKLRQDKGPVGGYYVIVDLAAHHDQALPFEPLRLRVMKGKANGEFGMTTPGRWYITSRLSGGMPTGRGREGYPTREAARADIARWLLAEQNGANDHGAYWS